MSKLIWAASFGIYVFFFLVIFRPFGLDTFSDSTTALYSLGFGAITFITMLLNLIILPKVFHKFFDEEQWTTGREILVTLVHIFLIGVINSVFVQLVFDIPTSLSRFIYLEFVTLVLAIVPVTVWTLIIENRLLKRNIQEANIINTSRKPLIEKTPQDDEVFIRSENKMESAKWRTDQIFYITSADNYIKIGILVNERFQVIMLRNTLKRVENDLRDFHMFFRCHRAFIVNLEKVEAVSGNARGLKLKLKNCPEEIPVSRALNEEISIRLENR
ncbi:MAG: LytTR family transcriptional regulator [Cyclobacteriaceae bacterium]|nr:LytTR family transcriptional regulator [Cyclobacteriaceae bacterium]